MTRALRIALVALALSAGCGNGLVNVPCHITGALNGDVDGTCDSAGGGGTAQFPEPDWNVGGHVVTGGRFALCTLVFIHNTAAPAGTFTIPTAPSDPLGSVHLWAAAGPSPQTDYAAPALSATVDVVEDHDGTRAEIDAVMPVLDVDGHPTAATSPLHCTLPLFQ